MKTIAVLLVFALLTGCSTKPVSFSSPMLLPQDAAFSCAFRQVNELGYTVTNTDKGAGYLTAEKVTRSHSLGSLGSNTHRDLLTVSIYATDSATRTMRVIAASSRDERSPVMVRTNGAKPSDQVRKDAGALLDACVKAGMRRDAGPAR
jgi:hypothetical protein